jgi:hypothetical protein
VDITLWTKKGGAHMAHKCKRPQSGHQVCAEHMLTKDGLRYRFRKQMQDTFSLEELAEFFKMMNSTMLPADNSIPLDDRPHTLIERIAKGGVAT